MSGSNVLKEFVVKLGWKNDEAQQRRFTEAVTSIGKSAFESTKGFLALGTAVAGTGVAAAVGLAKIAKPLESLYFASQRTNATVGELKTLQGAFEQIGISAEETQGSIEAFSAARRTMPGFNQMFHIDPKQTDDAKNFLQVLEQISAADTGGAYTHAIAAKRAAMAGISESTLTQFERNRAAFNKSILPNQEKLVGKFDMKKMADTAHDYATAFRNTATNAELTADKIATGVMPASEKVLGTTDKLADLYNKIDDKTGGWLGHLTAAAGVSSSILTTYKAIAKLRGILGGASVAEGTGAAAAGEGAAVGGGALLAVAGGLVAPVVAAVVGSSLLKKATKGTWWGSTDADQGIDPGTQQDPTKPKATGIADQIASMKASFASMVASVASFTAGFEGHAKGGYGEYKDVAGHDTVGYGHLVKPGEDFSKGLDKQGALAILTKDLSTAGDAVKRLVKVALNANQFKALQDFVFNLGADKLKNSTLLKELNAGHLDAAAAQFKNWDKVRQGDHLVSNEGLARRRAAEEALFRTPEKASGPVINQKIDITVEAGKDAQSTAAAVAKQQDRVNQNLTRNLQPGIS